MPVWYISSNAKDKLYTVENVPKKQVAVVFGAAILRSNIPSSVLADRVQVAVDLYNAGKVEKILMTGANPEFDYNEPEVMKQFAIKLGIPEDDIILDYAGLRTYDSCTRMQYFNVDNAILVTQSSHLPRAIFLCEKFGIKSVGVSADLRVYLDWRAQKIRETIAQIFAFWEATIFSHNPTHGADGSEETL